MNKNKWIKEIKSIPSMIKYILEIAAAMCTITGVSIHGADNLMSKKIEISETQSNNIVSPYTKIFIEYFIEHFWIIMSFSFLMVLIINGLVVPLYKIYKKDTPKEEAKPSPILVVIYSTLCVSFFIGSLISAAYAKEKPEENIEMIIEDIPYESQSNNQEDYLIMEKEVINEYIIRSSKEVIPIEELDLLNNNELYYLRNGIYAYSGMYFEGDYYKYFSWYNGIYSEAETINHINSIQWTNINNIKDIEKLRGK